MNENKRHFLFLSALLIILIISAAVLHRYSDMNQRAALEKKVDPVKFSITRKEFLRNFYSYKEHFFEIDHETARKRLMKRQAADSVSRLKIEELKKSLLAKAWKNILSGSLNEAEDILVRVRELNPDPEELSKLENELAERKSELKTENLNRMRRERKAEEMLEKVRLLYFEGRYQESLSLLDKLEEIDGGNPDIETFKNRNRAALNVKNAKDERGFIAEKPSPAPTKRGNIKPPKLSPSPSPGSALPLPSVDVILLGKTDIQERTPVEVLVRVSPSGDEYQVILYYKNKFMSEYKYERLSEENAGEYFGKIPKKHVKSPDMEYYVVVIDSKGNNLAEPAVKKVKVSKRQWVEPPL